LHVYSIKDKQWNYSSLSDLGIEWINLIQILLLPINNI
jgi:hypothetical protein